MLRVLVLLVGFSLFAQADEGLIEKVQKLEKRIEALEKKLADTPKGKVGGPSIEETVKWLNSFLKSPKARTSIIRKDRTSSRMSSSVYKDLKIDNEFLILKIEETLNYDYIVEFDMKIPIKMFRVEKYDGTVGNSKEIVESRGTHLMKSGRHFRYSIIISSSNGEDIFLTNTNTTIDKEKKTFKQKFNHYTIHLIDEESRDRALKALKHIQEKNGTKNLF